MINSKATDVLNKCIEKGVMLALAESCTGGMIAAALTEISGSSAVVERGFVTYTNEAKNEMIGVPMDLIKVHGAVSEDVARAMALGAIEYSKAQISVAVTGIAGPTGATPDKPVGLVHISCARENGTTLHERFVFKGGRSEVRAQAMMAALDMVLSNLD